MMENRQRIAALLLPSTVLLGLLFVIPLLLMVMLTFRESTFGTTAGAFTLHHYGEFFTNAAYQRLLGRSFLRSFWVALLTVVLAYPLAYYLAFQAGKHKVTLLTLIIAPAWISFLLRILAWKVLLGGSGALASLLAWLGLLREGTPVLLYSPTAVIITLVYVWAPFVALPIFAALERIEQELHEAAADLGATHWQTFWRVTFPLSLPGVLAGFLFVFIPTVGEYVTPTLVGGVDGIMIGNIIQDQFVRALNWPFGALMSVVLLLIVLIPLLIVGRFVRLTDLSGI
jgi:spermidine/putrescine transport system permease protein